MALHLIPHSSVAPRKPSPWKILDDQLMDLIIQRNQGIHFVRRSAESPPEAIEDVIEEIRKKLVHTKKTM